MTSKQLTVAMLMDDIREAKNISSVFRNLGVLAHYYSDLDSLWKSLNTEEHALVVVDVKLMSHKSISLAYHQKIRDEEIPLAFYYDDQSLPLLFSTYDIFHYGLIKKSVVYEGPIKGLLKRVNKFRKTQFVINQNEKKLENLEKQNEELYTLAQTYKLRDVQRKEIDEMMIDLKFGINSSDFYQSLVTVLSGWNIVEAFSVYTLGFNQQKLISPKSKSSKLRMLPSLWAGQICNNGIEPYAQSLALQVAVDLLNTNIVTLKISGAYEHPSTLIFIQADQEMLEAVPWKYLESQLSELYLRNEIKTNSANIKSSDIVSNWEFVSVLGNLQYEVKSQNNELVLIDFSKLMNLIHQYNFESFYFDQFFKDFSLKMNDVLKNKVLMTQFGLKFLAILVEGQEGEWFEELKDLVSKFSYWRYFDDVDLVLAKDLSPEVKKVPLGVKPYLDMVYFNEKNKTSNKFSKIIHHEV